MLLLHEYDHDVRLFSLLARFIIDLGALVYAFGSAFDVALLIFACICGSRMVTNITVARRFVIRIFDSFCPISLSTIIH